VIIPDIITDRQGKTIRRSPGGYGGYFNFHPFRSGMCWSPDGKQLPCQRDGAATDPYR
jgi:hypothetical protein